MPNSAPGPLGFATSIDVAKRANVSQTTVSRVFSGKGNVKPATVEKVMTAAAELGYSPNAIARSLTSRKTGIIALVSVRSVHSFYTSMVNFILEKCSALGKQVMYFQTEFEEDINQIFQNVLQYKVDGLIIISASTTYEIDEACRKINLPVAIIARSTFSPNAFSVSIDNVEAGRMVARHLLDKGYRSFGFLGSVRLSDIVQDRRTGYVEELRAHGIDELVEEQGTFTYESGCEAVRRMLDRGREMRALFSTNDLMAMGAMDVARAEYGLRVPEDLAIVGFDGIEEAGWGSYRLTTVQQPLEAMVDSAIDYLCRHIDDVPVRGGLQVFGCKLIERGSA